MLRAQTPNPCVALLCRRFTTDLSLRGAYEPLQRELLAWLQAHPKDDGVDFVCRAWLQAGGDYGPVQKYVEEWVQEHRDDPQAVYLLKEVSKQRQLTDPMLGSILHWCQRHADHPDAIWRLSRLGKGLLRGRMGEGVLAASQAVIKSQAASTSPSVCGVEGVLSLVLAAPELQGAERRRQVLASYRAWLLHPRAFTSPTQRRRFIERPAWVRGLGELLTEGSIDVAEAEDRAAIARFLAWLRGWFPKNRQAVCALLTALQTQFPSEIWSLGQS